MVTEWSPRRVGGGRGNGAPLGQGLSNPFVRLVAPLRVECVSTSPVCSSGEAAVAVLVERAGVLARAGGGGVLECFAAIGDPRCRRGIRHSLPTILGLCLAAVLAGR